ncbi:MAG TPA: metallophosphoesterase [Acidimicrobiales bacterium]|nr:metallophosphoesterase [Acidimicrobiales bacterium]
MSEPTGEPSARRELAPEVTTVSDESAVVFRGRRWKVYEGLRPATDYEYDGVAFRTLRRPPGERLATVATVNDLHLGETACGAIDAMPDVGPVLSSLPGEPPYPETMNAAAVEEILAAGADAVVAKGDLTDDGREEEYEAFLRCYRPVGDRLHLVPGNHDVHRGTGPVPHGPSKVEVAGAVLALLDTSVPGAAGGALDADQLGWLDDLAASAAVPVLVFGHHHAWAPGSARPATYFGIRPDDSEHLVALAARRPAVAGYFAGHTHRHRVRRFPATGTMPWAEVGAVKDFPGVWAEYRVHEGGVLQVVHRIRRPDALDWTERTRAMFSGLYGHYSFGTLADRCFEVDPRTPAAG